MNLQGMPAKNGLVNSEEFREAITVIIKSIMAGELSARNLPETYLEENQYIDIDKIYGILETLCIQAISSQKARDYAAKVAEENRAHEMTSDQFKNFCIQRFFEKNGKPFEIDRDNREIFELLVCYFLNDPAFEIYEGGFSLKKGIMLVGGTGTGKTEMMRMFAINPKSTFGVISARAVTDEYQAEGGEIVKKWWTAGFQPIIANDIFRHKVTGICFDDIGTESEGRFFGNQKNVIGDIILNRYDRKNEFRGLTHLTTNCNGDQIEQIYGSRVRSRLREMFNIIVFPGKAKDRRK